jgi:2-polyprenyl-3-methyl-5-hydroxy-6-metoxy-1,4-benzoquinol methylase|tara:strand:+ start:2728 stop:3609 length:882 start_codon:yes stop_codon:yes gene_type:complete
MTTIKEQYTRYPYLSYDVVDDEFAPNAIKLHEPFLTKKEINHYIKKDINDILSVGFGGGAEVIKLALEFPDARITAIEISKFSCAILKKRLKKYNIDNVDIQLKSLYKVKGSYDFITCAGVLHHLQNPDKGLNKLKSVLKDDGGILLMLYGKVGRTAVYQMQELMRTVNYPGNKDFPEQIERFKKIFKKLPRTNWLKRSEMLIADYKVNDAGIVDEFLNVQDEAYTITDFHNFVNKVGFKVLEYSEEFRKKYYHDIGIKLDKSISEVDKQYINELFFGDITKHTAYIIKDGNI